MNVYSLPLFEVKKETLVCTQVMILMDALYAVCGTTALLVAHEIGMFGAVGDSEKSIQELAASLAIPVRSVDALLTVAAAQGFVTARDGRYILTPLGRDYLLDSGPFSRKGMLDFARATTMLVSPDNLKKAVLSGHPFGYGEGEMFGAHEAQAVSLLGLCTAKARQRRVLGPANSTSLATDLCSM